MGNDADSVVMMILTKVGLGVLGEEDTNVDGCEEGLILCDSHLIDLFLARRGHRAVISAVDFTVTVAGFTISAGATGVSQLLLLIASLVLVFVVEHRLKIHHRPGMPGLPKVQTG